MRCVLKILVAFVAFAAGDWPLAAEDWPFVRGPHYNGHADATSLVDEFPPDGPPVLWTRPLGTGYSSITAQDDKLYTQYQTLGGQYVVCLDALTGRTLWEHRHALPYDPAGLYPGPRSTPTLAQGCVYFTAPSGTIGCLNADTGRPIWSLSLFEHFGVEPVEFGYSISPTVVDGQVFVPVGKPAAAMAALDAATGRVLWKSGNDRISHVPALPIERDGRRLVIGYLRNALAAFDRGTGEVVWRMPLSAGYDEHSAWPIYQEPYLWISAPFRAGSELIELTSTPPGYRTVWKSKLLSNDVCSSVLVDGHLYGFDLRDAQAKPHRPSRGQFRCLDFLTGKERWANGSLARQPPADAVGQACVLASDGKLVLWNDTGELILARASSERYEELGRVRVLGGEICWTVPLLYEGRLYVRNHSRIACLVLKMPDQVPSHDAPQLTVADIPQTAYRDWSALVLAVEPEYAMDLPTGEQLAAWYAASLACYFLSAVIAAFTTMVSRGDAQRFRRLLGLSAFLAGAVGTTLLSRLSGEFLFTWPLALFVAFQSTLSQTRPLTPSTASGLRGRLVLAAFLLLCLMYFLLCRRLSLAFEWVFLSGFFAAVPLLLLAHRQRRRTRLPLLWEGLLVIAAFTAYYWASVAVLWWRYD